MQNVAFIASYERPIRAPGMAWNWRGLAGHGLRVVAILLFAALIIGVHPAAIDACPEGALAICGP